MRSSPERAPNVRQMFAGGCSATPSRPVPYNVSRDVSPPSPSNPVRDTNNHLATSHHYGARALREFLAAPEHVQAAFMARVGGEAAAELDFDRWFAEAHDDDPVPPRLPAANLPRRPVRWDETWRKRACGARSAARADGRDFEAEREELRAIEAAVYVRELTGEEARFGKVDCVLPDHDEHTGSMHVYPDGGDWYCFGCGRGGSIYDLAGLLWGLETRGPRFREIHDRLRAVFA